MATDWIDDYANELKLEEEERVVRRQLAERRREVLDQKLGQIWRTLLREADRTVSELRKRRPAPRCAELGLESDPRTLSIWYPAYPTVHLEVTNSGDGFDVIYGLVLKVDSSRITKEERIEVTLDDEGIPRMTLQGEDCLNVEDLLKKLLGPILRPEMLQTR
jgi:hypothetical protein